MKRFIPDLRQWALIIAFGCAFSVGVRFVRSLAGPTESVPDLDSFSEPSVAAAILKKQAADLIREYEKSQEEKCQISCPGQNDDSIAASCGSGQFRPENPSRGIDPQGVPKSAPEWIRRIREAIRQREEALGMDELEDQLLRICQEQKQWNEFIDAYLQLLGRRPGSDIAVAWLRIALDYSAYCDRTEEMREVLEHLARFHRDRKLARRIKNVLDQWSRANGGSLVAGDF